MNRRFAILFILIPLLGAGCTMPFAGKKINPATDPLCLAWSSPSGFRAWIETYGQGEESAVQLAEYIRLPTKAEQKLLADLVASVDAGGNPAFLCTMDTRGQHVVWTIEHTDEASDTCTNTFYVSINGDGTTTDFTSSDRARNCTQMCKPKRLEENLLVWQCDLREEAPQAASWTQIHLNRNTGTSEAVTCQQDNLGMPSGCIR